LESQNVEWQANQLKVNLGQVAIPSSQAPWKDVVSFALDFDGVQFFGSVEKLRLFATNCIESYKEYGMLKDLNNDEIRSVLFYFAKTHEEEKSPPTGKDLKFILLLIEKLKK
jgi:hypothetical protein